MPFLTKKREAGFWHFKAKVGNSPADEKEQTLFNRFLVNKFLLGHPNGGTQREPNTCWDPPYLSHLIHIC